MTCRPIPRRIENPANPGLPSPQGHQGPGTPEPAKGRWTGVRPPGGSSSQDDRTEGLAERRHGLRHLGLFDCQQLNYLCPPAVPPPGRKASHPASRRNGPDRGGGGEWGRERSPAPPREMMMPRLVSDRVTGECLIDATLVAVERRPLATSILPEDLPHATTLHEFHDLVASLQATRSYPPPARGILVRQAPGRAGGAGPSRPVRPQGLDQPFAPAGDPIVLGRSLSGGRHFDVRETIEASVQITPACIPGP
jgi:hypothetical protein